MVNKDTVCKLAKTIVIAVAIIYVAYVVINIQPSAQGEERKLFPGILGDMLLKSNDTGTYMIKNMTLYDDFRGYVVQGYKATYSGVNGTMIIFIAQTLDNSSANESFNDMAIRIGYNKSVDINQSIKNSDPVIRLPVENPEVFLIQRNNSTIWHYTFTKLDKVYWIGFNSTNIEYHARMLMEVYRSVDST